MRQKLEQLQRGDHAALFYRSKAEQLACAIPYIAIGLQRNERCVYIAVDNSVPFIADRMEKYGIDVDQKVKSGALSIVTKEDSYLRGGLFEPEKMIDGFHSEVRSSLDKGFAGLRASGEMSWALDLPSAYAIVMDYEERLHARWPVELAGLCQFDESRFPAELIQQMIQMHQIIIRNGEIIRKTPERSLSLAEPAI